MPEKFRIELFWGTGDRDLYWEYKTKTKGEIYKQSKPFEGLLTNLERRVRETNSDYFRKGLFSFRTSKMLECECWGGTG